MITGPEVLFAYLAKCASCGMWNWQLYATTVVQTPCVKCNHILTWRKYTLIPAAELIGEEEGGGI